MPGQRAEAKPSEPVPSDPDTPDPLSVCGCHGGQWFAQVVDRILIRDQFSLELRTHENKILSSIN